MCFGEGRATGRSRKCISDHTWSIHTQARGLQFGTKRNVRVSFTNASGVHCSKATRVVAMVVFGKCRACTTRSAQTGSAPLLHLPRHGIVIQPFLRRHPSLNKLHKCIKYSFHFISLLIRNVDNKHTLSTQSCASFESTFPLMSLAVIILPSRLHKQIASY